MNKIPTLIEQRPSIAHLEHTTLLQVHGADALSFLQGQLSQDIANIETHCASIAGLSNPKGRLLAICHVYKVQDDEFWLTLPDSMRESVQTHLKKYVMRSKVQINPRDDLFVYGYWGGSSLDCEHRFPLAEFCDLSLGIHSHMLPVLELVEETVWDQQKVLNGIPDVFPDTQERFVAQMLNLDLLGGISFNKGCYTGQEIIARMQHLGRVKRRMLLVELENAPTIGKKLIIQEQNLGEIVNTSANGQKILALACIQLDKLKKISPTVQILAMKYTIPECLTIVNNYNKKLIQ